MLAELKDLSGCTWIVAVAAAVESIATRIMRQRRPLRF